MILERFNAITFVGDEHLRAIYIGLNVLINENLLRGGMSADADIECTCEKQLWKPECVGEMFKSSEEARQDLGPGMTAAKFYCPRMYSFSKIRGEYNELTESKV